MAREKSAWDRFRDREKEREEEEREKAGTAPSLGSPKPGAPTAASGNDPVLVEMIQKAEALIDQIQGLYNMFIAGMERMPPVAQRKQLEDIAFKIYAAAKTNVSLKFRTQQFQAKHQLYKDKWDKLMKDIEAGRVVVKKRG